MDIAKRKAVKYDPKLISFVKGDAEDLPFENASFNAYIMCFGLRYCQNIDKVFNHVENKVVNWSGMCLVTGINKTIALKVIEAYSVSNMLILNIML
jgi:ubiquinone/menaquinone biosynthesis C-methylase UbiE